MAKYFKKQSKRITTKKRTKIERKVREHNKKVRKESKKGLHSFQKKRKEGLVPNEAPFKDDVLKEAEDRKQRLEEERQKQLVRRKRAREKARMQKRSLAGLVADAAQRGKEFDSKKEFIATHGEKFLGHKNVEMSLKQYYKEFKKVIDAADVVLEVLDARDPLGSRCPQVEEAVLNAGPNKRLVLLLNKVDLVPQENVEQWLKYLRTEYPTIAFKASTQSQNENLSRSKVPLTLASEDLRKSSRCLGAEILLKLLGNYCRNKDIRTSITVGIVGFPNTGKSSIINSLKRSKACNTGATPGVTKVMQSIQLDKHINLLDSPGIVMASGSDAGAVLKNAVRVETIEDPVPAVDAVLRRCTKQKLMLQYNLGDFSDVHEFLALLATKRGRLKKGGVPDTLRAGRLVLQDWNQGRITYYTHPPEEKVKDTHLDAKIITQMSAEFDIDSLVNEEKKTLTGLKDTSNMDIVISSEGPTQAEFADEGPSEDMEAREDSEDEAMEEDDENGTKFTVAVLARASQRSSKQPSGDAKQPKDKEVTEAASGPNLMMNKQRKKDFKKMKKDRKRADVLAGELADAFEGAIDNLNKNDSDEDYDFKTDFKT